MSGFSGYNTAALGLQVLPFRDRGQIKHICSWKNFTAQARGQFLPKRMCYSRGFNRWEKEKKQQQEDKSSTDGKQDWDWPSNVIKKTPNWIILLIFFMTLSCLKSYTLGCASSCNFFILFLFPSYTMLVQCTNAGLFPFYQYTCKLLSSKVTSEVLFNCLFIFAFSCMVPSACRCSLHFHAMCQCCFISKLGCKCVCGIFLLTSHEQIFVWLVF